jgi:tetratricopeptide (TPR) repeat protein
MTVGISLMTIVRTLCLVVSLVGFAGAGFADQTDPRLDALFGRLKAASGPAESVSIEGEIWAIWLVAPDEATQSRLDSGIDAMGRGDLAAALEAFDEVVALAPGFAEGWNKRATVHYLLNNLQQSLEDIAATLKLEPRHFGALSGRGLVFIKLRDLEQALSAFEEVLEVSPQMTSARANIDAIRKVLGQREI